MEQEKLIFLGVLAGIYIVVMPIILALIPFLHKKLIIQKKMNRMAPNERSRYKPNLLGPIWRERLSYTMKDKRDFSLSSGKKKKDGEPSSSKIQNRQMLFILWAVGLVVVVVGGFLSNWYILAAGYIIFFFAVGFGITVSKDMIEARKRIMTRLFEIANSKLGIGQEYAENPGAVIKVLEWSDPLKPAKIEFTVPTTFNAEMGEEGFLRQFNQVFGQETTWVPFDDKETGKPGWNYEEGIATFYAVPPLPTMAKWAEHYVTGEGVAWSFFPIALGVENGLSLPNPETGEVENVLGFDFSGEQTSVAKKHGLKVGGEITTSPMAFVGGGTGSGKSLAVNTLVQVIENPDEINILKNS